MLPDGNEPLSAASRLSIAADLSHTSLWSLIHILLCAHRDAEEGFHKCPLCGFENFKRFVFCTVCGGQLHAPSCDEVGVTSFEVIIHLTKAEVQQMGGKGKLTTRQHRARYVNDLVAGSRCFPGGGANSSGLPLVPHLFFLADNVENGHGNSMRRANCSGAEAEVAAR